MTRRQERDKNHRWKGYHGEQYISQHCERPERKRAIKFSWKIREKLKLWVCAQFSDPPRHTSFLTRSRKICTASQRFFFYLVCQFLVQLICYGFTQINAKVPWFDPHCIFHFSHDKHLGRIWQAFHAFDEEYWALVDQNKNIEGWGGLGELRTNFITFISVIQ